jgi:hypothetical protein
MKRHNIILRFRINNGELLKIWEHKWGGKKRNGERMGM